MTDHENELVIGVNQDGQPVKVAIVAEENIFNSLLRRYWDNLAKRFAGLQVEVLDPMAPQICPCRHCGGKPGGCPPEN